MDETTPTPTSSTPAPAATTPAAAPAPATSTPPAAPAATEKKSSLLSNILGLVKPDEVDVKPKPDDAEAKAKADAEAKAKADADAKAKADADAKAKADAEAKAKETPPVEPKRVSVKRKEAAPPTPSADEVRRIAAEEAAKAAKAAQPAAATQSDDSELTPEERDELELARLAEVKDPSKKGLADRFRKFYQEQKAFLEKRATAEGEEYDPSQDPEYKRFLAKHEPKLSPAERKQLREQKIAAEAAAQATKAAEERFTPEIERLRLKTLEIEHKPKIEERVTRYVDEVASGMPEDIVKFFRDNGQSVEKTKEAYPDEFEIIAQTLAGARALANEALGLRRGIIKFDLKNSSHEFLDGFVDRQAKAVLSGPKEQQVRDGKTFIHPYDFTPDKANTHWTFDDEDILESLKLASQSEAKNRINTFRKRVNAAVEAQKRRSAAPSGASTPPSQPAAAPSTRTPPAPAPGAATPVTKPKSVLSGLLGLG